MNLNFTLILQIISFLILLGLLAKFLYKPLAKYLDERAHSIREMTNNARRAEEKARGYAEQTHKALDMAREEALKIKDEAKRLSDVERRRLIDEAKKEAAYLIDEAKKQLGKEKEILLKRIRSEIAGMSVDIAKRVLGREIKKQDHARFIDESIKEIEDAVSGS